MVSGTISVSPVKVGVARMKRSARTRSSVVTPTRNGLAACCSAKRASVWLPLRSVRPGAMPATRNLGAKD